MPYRLAEWLNELKNEFKFNSYSDNGIEMVNGVKVLKATTKIKLLTSTYTQTKYVRLPQIKPVIYAMCRSIFVRMHNASCHSAQLV